MLQHKTKRNAFKTLVHKLAKAGCMGSILTGSLLIGSTAAQASVTSAVLDEQAGFQSVTWTNDTVLVSGTHGSVYLSHDNGKNFTRLNLPMGTEALQFRDNQWFEDGHIVVMSAGEGEQSRLYYSASKGNDWQLVKQGEHEHVFFDCMSFTRGGEGWLYGDSDDEGLYILHTQNAGKDWSRKALPFNAAPSEGGFASSGTCITANESLVAAGTGNSGKPALLLKKGQQDWQRISSLFEGGEAAGMFSLQVSENTLYAFGGSLKHEQPATAFTFDLAESVWQALPTPPLNGAIYGSALYFSASHKAIPSILISNPQGVFALSPKTKQWQKVSESNIWSLACKADEGCIGVGKGGVVEKYSHELLSVGQ